MLDQAKREGLLDHTLVIITADESRGARVGAELNQKLAHHWGSLVVLTPEGTKGLVTTPFHQADLALSILDYIGYRGGESRFPGRSIFRKYKVKRPQVFGYSGDSQLWAYDGQQQLTDCNIKVTDCTSYATTDEQMFTGRFEQLPSHSEHDVALIKAFIGANERSAPPVPLSHMQLADFKPITVNNAARYQEVLGRKVGPLLPKWQGRVRLKIRLVSGEANITIYNQLQLLDNLKQISRAEIGAKRLTAGEVLFAEYIVNSVDKKWNMYPNVDVEPQEGQAVVQFEEAEAVLELAPHAFSEGITFKRFALMK